MVLDFLVPCIYFKKPTNRSRLVEKKSLKMMMAVILLCAAYILSREGSILVDKTLREKKGVIIVDAGHGGIDPGVVGIDNMKEKDINLKIAEYLKEELEKAGYKIIMTRTKDEGLYEDSCRNKKVQDLQRRCELIKETKPLLIVSIHQNSYQDPSVCGPQVFYYTHSVKGQEMAKCIQDALNKQLEIQRPRIEKGNTSYYLLKRSEGVLNIIETGFLTNPKEAKLLKEKEYQKKAARAICDGILKYLGDLEKEGEGLAWGDAGMI